MAKLRQDVPIEFNLSNHSILKLDTERGTDFLKGLEFKTLTNRLHNWANPAEETEVKEIKLPELMQDEEKEKKKEKEKSEQLSLF